MGLSVMPLTLRKPSMMPGETAAVADAKDALVVAVQLALK